PATGLLPQSFEDESGPDASRRARRYSAVGDGVDDNGFRGEACARSQQPLQLPALAQLLDAAKRRDHLLAHLRALAAAFDDLEIGAAARGLLAEIHIAEPYRRLVRGTHILRLQSQIETTRTWHYTFAKITPPSKQYQWLTMRSPAATVEDQHDRSKYH